LSILFANIRERVYRLYTQLRNDGLRVMLLHGGLRQEVRERTLARFRGMRDAALVSTDLASRGLDIIDVNLIVNFDAPRDPETYIHRIGRTARLNNRGKAITLAARSELRILDEAARLTGVDYTIAND
jgi:superfamily II DNA/RNA helicase